jgi:hypothetical protein
MTCEVNGSASCRIKRIENWPQGIGLGAFLGACSGSPASRGVSSSGLLDTFMTVVIVVYSREPQHGQMEQSELVGSESSKSARVLVRFGRREEGKRASVRSTPITPFCFSTHNLSRYAR